MAAAVANARTIADVAGNHKLAKKSESGRYTRARDDAAAAAILAVSLGWRKVLQSPEVKVAKSYVVR